MSLGRAARAHLEAAPSASTPLRPRARRLVDAAAGAMAVALSLGAARVFADPAADAGAMLLQKAARANAAEIKTSQVAQTRAVDPAVKAFADRMVEEHTANEHALEAIAKRKNVAVTLDPDPDRQIRIGTL